MSSLTQWFHEILQAAFWHAFFTHFQWLDWITFVSVLLGLFMGMKKGLLREMVEIFELLIVITIVFEYTPEIAFLLKTGWTKISEGYARALAFFLLAVAVLLAVHFLDKIMQNWAHTQMIAPLRMVGGALLGGFHVLLLLSFFSQPILAIPVPAIRHLYQPENSLVGYGLSFLAPKAHQEMMQPIRLLQQKD